MAHIQCAKVIPGRRFEVYDFMTAPDKIGTQLSGIINVKWQNPGVEIAQGSEFLFLMERFGVEQPIRFTIEKLVLGHSLTYRQVSGLFSTFIHTLKFEDHGGNDTLVTDIIEYELPFGILGRMADDLIVKADLTRILQRRFETVKDYFLKPKVEVSLQH